MARSHATSGRASMAHAALTRRRYLIRNILQFKCLAARHIIIQINN
jgi:hypothetical protein